MSIPVSAATNAYAAASGLSGAGPQAKTDTESDFSAVLKQAVESVVETGRRADEVTIKAVSGETNVVDVVTAMAETELALETMVSVRDRIVSAYEEIMRMPI